MCATCTLATLKGRYLFGGISTLLPPLAPQQSLLSVAGYHIFNGDGTGTDIVTAVLNGESVEKNAGENPDRSEYDTTYTVNPDCSGTFTVPAAGVFLDLYIAPNGEELITIGTTPGDVSVLGPSRRVSRRQNSAGVVGGAGQAAVSQTQSSSLPTEVKDVLTCFARSPCASGTGPPPPGGRGHHSISSTVL